LKDRPLCFLFLFLVLASCHTGRAASGRQQELVIFAASSLTDAFNELAEAFEIQNDDVEVLLNFAGSSQLAAQLAEGAAADLFASANATQMQNVIDSGRIQVDKAILFASNRLTVIVPADNPAGIRSLEDLAQPGVQLILAVEGVPIRQYTDEIVSAMSADFQEDFYANLVSEEENVRQVSAKIALGEADASIVYTSDITPDIANQVQKIAIPDEQNVIATYPMGPLADGAHPEIARRFIDLALSPEGQEILSEWGFGPPTGKSNQE
jgi:molybdate transport system substrate-binding protein